MSRRAHDDLVAVELLERDPRLTAHGGRDLLVQHVLDVLWVVCGRVVVYMRGMTDRPLADRVALVAGATRGCGRAIAVELGALGATVYGSGRSPTAARSPMNRPERGL